MVIKNLFVAVALPIVVIACFGSFAWAQDAGSDKSLNAQMIEFAKRADEVRVKKLLDEGANPNTRNRSGETALYLNGEPVGSLSPRKQTFTWKIADARIYLGLSYIGLFDELTIFDRALKAAEVKKLHQLPGGVKALLK